MAGVGPAIHVFAAAQKAWMPGTSPGMTIPQEIPRKVSNAHFAPLCNRSRILGQTVRTPTYQPNALSSRSLAGSILPLRQPGVEGPEIRKIPRQ